MIPRLRFTVTGVTAVMSLCASFIFNRMEIFFYDPADYLILLLSLPTNSNAAGPATPGFGISMPLTPES